MDEQLAMRVLLFFALALPLAAQFPIQPGVLNAAAASTSGPVNVLTNYQTGTANTSGRNSVTNPTLTIVLKDPYFTSGSCAVLVVSYDSTNLTLGTPTDDGSETWAAASGAAITGGGVGLKAFTVLGTSSSTRVITVTTTGSTTTDYLGAWVTQVNSCSTSAIGGTGSLSFTANGSAHNLTLGASPSSGDFVVEYTLDRTAPSPTAPFASAITVGSGFTFLSNSTGYGKAAQYNISTTSTTVPITYAGSHSILAVALTILQGSSGASIGAGKHIPFYQVENYGTGTHTAHFPCPGCNLIVGMVTSPDIHITAATSTNCTSTWAGFTLNTNYGVQTTQSSVAQIFYAPNVSSCTANATVSATFSGTSAGYVEIAYAGITGANTSPFDNSHVTNNINQSTNGNLTCDTITPGHTGDLVLNVCTLDFHTITGTVTDANSHTPVLAQAVDSKGDNGTGSTQSIASTLDEDDGRAFFFNSDTMALSFIYANTTSLGTSPTGTGPDVGVSTAFQ